MRFVSAAEPQMQFPTRVLVAFFFFLSGTIMPTVSQTLQSRLIVFLASEPSESHVLLFKDANEKIVSDAKWISGLPFSREFIVPQNEYTLVFPGPLRSIEIETSSEVATFVYYSAVTPEKGIQVTTWQGEPNATITKALSEFKKLGVDVNPVALDLGPAGTKIFLSTDPPWPNPFDPPPPPKK
jgi:hypothetical protein